MINAVKGADSDILDVLLVGDVKGKLLVKCVASYSFKVMGLTLIASLSPSLWGNCIYPLLALS